MSGISLVSFGGDRFSKFPGIRKNCIVYWYQFEPSPEIIKICPGLNKGHELQKLLTGFSVDKTYYQQKYFDAQLAWGLSGCKETKERFDNAEKIRNMFCYCNNLREIFLEYKMSIENYLCTKWKNDKENVQILEEKIKSFGDFVETLEVSSDNKSKNKKWSFEKKEQEKCKFEYMEDEEEIKEMNNSIDIFSKFCEGVCRYIGIYKEIFENVIKKEEK